MKAGTAQKLVLNMLTTGAMIKSGKVFGNLMVDVEATNAKLIQRQTNIVVEATGVSAEQAEAALAACGRHCKTAILMILGVLAQSKPHKTGAAPRLYPRSAQPRINSREKEPMMAKITQTMMAQVLSLVGGSGNVAKCGNCMTRLRLTLNNSALADHAALKKFLE